MTTAGERQRKQRSDKKAHVNPALDQDTHRKLKRLALACDMTKTALAAEIIEIAVNTPSFINYLQKIHDAGEFRVIPMTDNGRVVY
ncbi:hypothetical protein [Alicyclobacillus macrosporangiidus]|uniref:hypothetical protein n=1 Tax=Alicyclobacillus macrosporangiidus TaxID=392015 RepID=UPI00049800AF|nr:hypothetical protein [Alicyclobacillus macrosporangiidus]